MKKILIVSKCGKRRDTIGLIGGILDVFENLDKSKYEVSLLDTDFFERNHNPSDYKVDNYFCITNCLIDNIIRRIPRMRSIYADKMAVKTYKRLLSHNHYEVVIIYQIPGYADKLVKYAHLYGSKIYFEPFGSDILRVSDKTKRCLMKAFSEVDGVCGRPNTGTVIAAQEIYHVPQSKIKEQKLISDGVKMLMNVRGTLSRREMMDNLGIPYSGYNIVCGYSGRKSHRHREIIDSLIKVKEVLPHNYQIIFPMTYGAGAHHEIILNYAKQLKEICDLAGLNTVFLTSFITSQQIAFLHLVTDLFIEIQPTDNGNAFMIEALYAQNQIVTGRWLNYQQFEQFGLPYYLIDSPSELPKMLRNIFTNQIDKVTIPQTLIDYLTIPEDYDASTFWVELFNESK